MKTSIKISTIILALVGISAAAKAQNTGTSSTSSSTSSPGVIFSVGADVGYSTGNFRNSYRWNAGGSVQADIPVASNFFFTANLGYLNSFGRNDVNGTGLQAPDIHLLPVKAGIRYFPIPMLYLQADAGAAFALNKSDVGLDKTAAFIYSPQVGVQLPIGGKSYIDAGILYQSSTKYISSVDDSKINFLGLRVAYAFGIK
ncbi:MAG TPA: hypothetical protein VGM63_05905 [Mucilaginibacter sp.]